MSLDDVIKAFGAFNQGVGEAATITAIDEAKQRVDQFRQQGLKDAELRKGLQQTADDLALKLAGTGASGTQIQTAFKAIAPQQFATPQQAILEGQLSGNEFIGQAGAEAIEDIGLAKEPEKERDHNRRLRLQANALAGQAGVQDKKQQQIMGRQIIKLAKDFRQDNKEAAKRMDQLQKLADTDSVADLSPNSIKFARTTLLKSAGEDRITNEDFERSNLNTSIWASARRGFNELLLNRVLPADKEVLNAMIEVYNERESFRLRDRASTRSQLDSELPGFETIDRDQLEDLYLSRVFLKPQRLEDGGETTTPSGKKGGSGLKSRFFKGNK